MAGIPLEKAIYETVRYFDLFAMPLTATQLWRCLVTPNGDGGDIALREVQLALVGSPFLQQALGMKWGFYFLKGKEYLVRERLSRHAQAQMKWKILKKVARFLAVVPFVRALAASGSLAIDNTKQSSDLDVFVVVKSGRIWTARLLLLIVVQLMGRRRKYWNQEAPDMVCLNHYVTDTNLLMPQQVQNLYTAVQYSLHVPLYGQDVMARFRQVNEAWIHRLVGSARLPSLPHGYALAISPLAQALKGFFESWLMEPVGGAVEELARRFQYFLIHEHHTIGRAGRVVTTESELAFHPDTKVPALLAEYFLT